MPLATVTRSGSTPGVLDCPPAAGPAHPGLDLVGDQDDPVLVAQLAQPAQEGGRGGEVAALALDRLDHDGGDVLRGDLAAEDRLAQVLELGGAIPAGRFAPAADARERRVMDHRQQWPEAGPLLDLRVGQGERAHGAAVEAALERDDPRPMRVIAGELDRALDRLGPRVREEDAGLLGERRDPRQPLHELEVARLVEVGRGDVDEPIRLFLDRRAHLRMGMPGRADGDAGGEVEEAVAVDVRDDHARLRTPRRAGRRASATGWRRPRRGR